DPQEVTPDPTRMAAAPWTVDSDTYVLGRDQPTPLVESDRASIFAPQESELGISASAVDPPNVLIPVDSVIIPDEIAPRECAAAATAMSKRLETPGNAAEPGLIAVGQPDSQSAAPATIEPDLVARASSVSSADSPEPLAFLLPGRAGKPD